MPRLIAIGDVHGQAIALYKLIELIRPTEGDEFVFLGDLIDRGPDSASVLNVALNNAQFFPTHFVLGNHEEMLLAAMTSKSELRFWLSHGGSQALKSWGVNPLTVSSHDLYRLPEHHLKLIANMENYYETDGHIFVHAAYHPNIAMHQQSSTNLRWVELPDDLGPHYSRKTVWCGHSRQQMVVDRGHVVCIDTGCGLKVKPNWPNVLTGVDVLTRTIYQVDQDGQQF